MADSEHLRVVKFGKHASANDFTADAASTIFLSPEGAIDVSGLTQTKLERDLRRGDNERHARVNGAKEGSFSYALEARGISGNDGTAVAEGDLELATLFDLAFGSAGSYDGDAVTADTVFALAEATPSMTVATSGADFTAGNAVLFPVGASTTEFVAREIKSISTNVLTLDRGGWTGSTTGGTVYPSASWHVDCDNHKPTHGYFFFEGENFAREAHGCMVATTTIRVTPGGKVMVDFAWQASDWSKATEANATYSAASAGSPIVALDSPFYMGDAGTTFANDSQFYVNELTVTITNTLAPRSTPGAVNGIAGFHVAKREVTVAGVLYFGSLTNDATDTLLTTLNTSEKTMDCGVQLGRDPGAAAYLRFPALDFDATVSTLNGMDALAFTAMATRSGNHSTVPGPMRAHIF